MRWVKKCYGIEFKLQSVACISGNSHHDRWLRGCRQLSLVTTNNKLQAHTHTHVQMERERLFRHLDAHTCTEKMPRLELMASRDKVFRFIPKRHNHEYIFWQFVFHAWDKMSKIAFRSMAFWDKPNTLSQDAMNSGPWLFSVCKNLLYVFLAWTFGPSFRNVIKCERTERASEKKMYRIANS